MGRLAKTALILFAAVVVLVIAAMVAIRVLPDTDLIKRNAEKHLSALTGQEVSLGGATVSVSFPDVVSITLEGLAIRTKRNQPLFSAETVAFSPSLSGLLRGEVNIETVSLKRFRGSILRGTDGTIVLPPLPAPGVSAQGAGGRGKPSEQQSEPRSSPVDRGIGARLRYLAETSPKLSIKNIRLSDGRIDWIDETLSPGKETVISLTEINGAIHETSPGTAFQADLSARLGKKGETGNNLKLQGFVGMTADRLRPEEGRISLTAPSLDPMIFDAYFPQKLSKVGKLNQIGIDVKANLSRERPRLLSFDVGLKLIADAPRGVNLRGYAVATERFDGIEEIRCDGKADSIPLRLLGDLVPPEVPLDIRAGFAKAEVKGMWTPAADWRFMGQVSVRDLSPTGKFLVLGQRLGLETRFELEPSRLVIEDATVSGSAKLARISGTIEKPLSVNPKVDLKGEAALRESWLEALGVQLPKGCRIEVPIPLKGRLTGALDDLRFRFTGNATRNTLSLSPQLEKPAGKKLSFSAEGTVSGIVSHGAGSPTVEAEARVDIVGARVRMAAGRRWLPDLVVSGRGKISVRGKRADLTDAKVTVTRGIKGKEILQASARATGLGSPGLRVQGKAVAQLDERIVAFAGPVGVPDLAIKGTAPIRLAFTGRPSLINWSLNLDLDKLDIKVEKKFHKPPGVKIDVAASGKLSEKGLDLTEAVVTLPGATATAHGLLIDGKGRFGRLTVEVKEGEVAALVPLLPQAKLSGLSGTYRLTARVKETKEGLAPVGTITIPGVRFKPPKALWSLEDITGTIDFHGDSVSIRELRGRVEGNAVGPWTVTGALKKVASPEETHGRLSYRMDKGRVKTIYMVRILNSAHSVFGRLLQPRPTAMEGDFLPFSVAAGDFQVEKGVATTNNFRMKGHEISTGIVGSINLTTLYMDVLLGIHVVMIGSDTLGKIDVVRKFMNEHRDMLAKITVTVFAQVKGPADVGLEVIPKKEWEIDPKTVTRLKTLLR